MADYIFIHTYVYPIINCDSAIFISIVYFSTIIHTQFLIWL